MKCTSNFKNLILEKDAQYLSNYYIESMLKWYYFLYIELNKATIKVKKKKRSRRDLWLLFSHHSYLVISAFYQQYCGHEHLLDSCVCSLFLPDALLLILLQTTLNLGPQNFKKLNLLCKKRDFSRGSPLSGVPFSKVLSILWCNKEHPGDRKWRLLHPKFPAFPGISHLAVSLSS